jgi:hypothetical protein
VGEAKFGLINGVVSTRPGFLENREVVEVEYDPHVISYENLVKKALKAECTAPVFTRTEAQHRIATKIVGDIAVLSSDRIKPDKEPKYYLSRTSLKFLPMTPLQAARVNATINEPDHRTLLSPEQLELLAFIEAHPKAGWKNVIGLDLVTAWKAAGMIRDKVARR